MLCDLGSDESLPRAFTSSDRAEGLNVPSRPQAGQKGFYAHSRPRVGQRSFTCLRDFRSDGGLECAFVALGQIEGLECAFVTSDQTKVFHVPS
ncbi:hypothetical protein PanWU01x14_201280 [Parasponia andersonii]|uniref:Uncharacterized protein n=1 Tax=Parasponia andersonii TaxID=3476 RepID=A0A2P5BXR7_PARAD|nr:hypothetical protein PanWU01x14_201280 [Parasponia andersonii]